MEFEFERVVAALYLLLFIVFFIKEIRDGKNIEMSLA